MSENKPEQSDLPASKKQPEAVVKTASATVGDDSKKVPAEKRVRRQGSQNASPVTPRRRSSSKDGEQAKVDGTKPKPKASPLSSPKEKPKLSKEHGPRRKDIKTFVIPRKAKEKELLEEISLDSNSFQKYLLPAIVQQYRDPASRASYEYQKASLVHNEKLEKEFQERRKELKEDGRTDKELAEQYAFLLVENMALAKLICSDGLHARWTGESKERQLGRGEMGVYLNRYSDILSPEALDPSKEHILLVFKVLKGKVKVVPLAPYKQAIEPTPKFDSHVAKNILNDLTTSGYRIMTFVSHQIYCYQFGELDMVPRPQQVCPFAVVHFKYTERQKESTTTGTAFNEVATKKDMEKEDGAKGKKVPLLSTAYKTPVTLWKGKLFNGGKEQCSASVTSSRLPYLPIELPRRLDLSIALPISRIKQVMPADIAKHPKLCHLSRFHEVSAKGRYFTYAQMKRIGDKTAFVNLCKCLKDNQMALQKKMENRLLFILPPCSLTDELGIAKSVKTQVLHVIFISNKSTYKSFLDISLNNSLSGSDDDRPPLPVINQLKSAEMKAELGKLFQRENNFYLAENEKAKPATPARVSTTPRSSHNSVERQVSSERAKTDVKPPKEAVLKDTTNSKSSGDPVAKPNHVLPLPSRVEPVPSGRLEQVEGSFSPIEDDSPPPSASGPNEPLKEKEKEEKKSAGENVAKGVEAKDKAAEPPGRPHFTHPPRPTRVFAQAPGVLPDINQQISQLTELVKVKERIATLTSPASSNASPNNNIHDCQNRIKELKSNLDRLLQERANLKQAEELQATFKRQRTAERLQAMSARAHGQPMTPRTPQLPVPKNSAGMVTPQSSQSGRLADHSSLNSSVASDPEPYFSTPGGEFPAMPSMPLAEKKEATTTAPTPITTSSQIFECLKGILTSPHILRQAATMPDPPGDPHHPAQRRRDPLSPAGLTLDSLKSILGRVQGAQPNEHQPSTSTGYPHPPGVNDVGPSSTFAAPLDAENNNKRQVEEEESTAPTKRLKTGEDPVTKQLSAILSNVAKKDDANVPATPQSPPLWETLSLVHKEIPPETPESPPPWDKCNDVAGGSRQNGESHWSRNVVVKEEKSKQLMVTIKGTPIPNRTREGSSDLYTLVKTVLHGVTRKMAAAAMKNDYDFAPPTKQEEHLQEIVLNTLHMQNPGHSQIQYGAARRVQEVARPLENSLPNSQRSSPRAGNSPHSGSSPHPVNSPRLGNSPRLSNSPRVGSSPRLGSSPVGSSASTGSNHSMSPPPPKGPSSIIKDGTSFLGDLTREDGVSIGRPTPHGGWGDRTKEHQRHSSSSSSSSSKSKVPKHRSDRKRRKHGLLGQAHSFKALAIETTTKTVSSVAADCSPEFKNCLSNMKQKQLEQISAVGRKEEIIKRLFDSPPPNRTERDSLKEPGELSSDSCFSYVSTPVLEIDENPHLWSTERLSRNIRGILCKSSEGHFSQVSSVESDGSVGLSEVRPGNSVNTSKELSKAPFPQTLVSETKRLDNTGMQPASQRNEDIVKDGTIVYFTAGSILDDSGQGLNASTMKEGTSVTSDMSVSETDSTGPEIELNVKYEKSLQQISSDNSIQPVEDKNGPSGQSGYATTAGNDDRVCSREEEPSLVPSSHMPGPLPFTGHVSQTAVSYGYTTMSEKQVIVDGNSASGQIYFPSADGNDGIVSTGHDEHSLVSKQMSLLERLTLPSTAQMSELSASDTDMSDMISVSENNLLQAKEIKEENVSHPIEDTVCPQGGESFSLEPLGATTNHSSLCDQNANEVNRPHFATGIGLGGGISTSTQCVNHVSGDGNTLAVICGQLCERNAQVEENAVIDITSETCPLPIVQSMPQQENTMPAPDQGWMQRGQPSHFHVKKEIDEQYSGRESHLDTNCVDLTSENFCELPSSSHGIMQQNNSMSLHAQEFPSNGPPYGVHNQQEEDQQSCSGGAQSANNFYLKAVNCQLPIDQNIPQQQSNVSTQDQEGFVTGHSSDFPNQNKVDEQYYAEDAPLKNNSSNLASENCLLPVVQDSSTSAEECTGSGYSSDVYNPSWTHQQNCGGDAGLNNNFIGLASGGCQLPVVQSMTQQQNTVSTQDQEGFVTGHSFDFPNQSKGDEQFYAGIAPLKNNSFNLASENCLLPLGHGTSQQHSSTSIQGQECTGKGYSSDVYIQSGTNQQNWEEDAGLDNNSGRCQLPVVQGMTQQFTMAISKEERQHSLTSTQEQECTGTGYSSDVYIQSGTNQQNWEKDAGLDNNSVGCQLPVVQGMTQQFAMAISMEEQQHSLTSTQEQECTGTGYSSDVYIQSGTNQQNWEKDGALGINSGGRQLPVVQGMTQQQFTLSSSKEEHPGSGYSDVYTKQEIDDNNNQTDVMNFNNSQGTPQALSDLSTSIKTVESNAEHGMQNQHPPMIDVSTAINAGPPMDANRKNDQSDTTQGSESCDMRFKDKYLSMAESSVIGEVDGHTGPKLCESSKELVVPSNSQQNSTLLPLSPMATYLGDGSTHGSAEPSLPREVTGHIDRTDSPSPSLLNSSLLPPDPNATYLEAASSNLSIIDHEKEKPSTPLRTDKLQATKVTTPEEQIQSRKDLVSILFGTALKSPVGVAFKCSSSESDHGCQSPTKHDLCKDNKHELAECTRGEMDSSKTSFESGDISQIGRKLEDRDETRLHAMDTYGLTKFCLSMPMTMRKVLPEAIDNNSYSQVFRADVQPNMGNANSVSPSGEDQHPFQKFSHNQECQNLEVSLDEVKPTINGEGIASNGANDIAERASTPEILRMLDETLDMGKKGSCDDARHVKRKPLPLKKALLMSKSWETNRVQQAMEKNGMSHSPCDEGGLSDIASTEESNIATPEILSMLDEALEEDTQKTEDTSNSNVTDKKAVPLKKSLLLKKVSEWKNKTINTSSIPSVIEVESGHTFHEKSKDSPKVQVRDSSLTSPSTAYAKRLRQRLDDLRAGIQRKVEEHDGKVLLVSDGSGDSNLKNRNMLKWRSKESSKSKKKKLRPKKLRHKSHAESSDKSSDIKILQSLDALASKLSGCLIKPREITKDSSSDREPGTPQKWDTPFKCPPKPKYGTSPRTLPFKKDYTASMIPQTPPLRRNVFGSFVPEDTKGQSPMLAEVTRNERQHKVSKKTSTSKVILRPPVFAVSAKPPVVKYDEHEKLPKESNIVEPPFVVKCDGQEKSSKESDIVKPPVVMCDRQEKSPKGSNIVKLPVVKCDGQEKSPKKSDISAPDHSERADGKVAESIEHSSPISSHLAATAESSNSQHLDENPPTQLYNPLHFPSMLGRYSAPSSFWPLFFKYVIQQRMAQRVYYQYALGMLSASLRGPLLPQPNVMYSQQSSCIDKGRKLQKVEHPNYTGPKNAIDETQHSEELRVPLPGLHSTEAKQGGVRSPGGRQAMQGGLLPEQRLESQQNSEVLSNLEDVGNCASRTMPSEANLGDRKIKVAESTDVADNSIEPGMVNKDLFCLEISPKLPAPSVDSLDPSDKKNSSENANKAGSAKIIKQMELTRLLNQSDVSVNQAVPATILASENLRGKASNSTETHTTPSQVSDKQAVPFVWNDSYVTHVTDPDALYTPVCSKKRSPSMPIPDMPAQSSDKLQPGRTTAVIASSATPDDKDVEESKLVIKRKAIMSEDASPLAIVSGLKSNLSDHQPGQVNFIYPDRKGLVAEKETLTKTTGSALEDARENDEMDLAMRESVPTVLTESMLSSVLSLADHDYCTSKTKHKAVAPETVIKKHRKKKKKSHSRKEEVLHGIKLLCTTSTLSATTSTRHIEEQNKEAKLHSNEPSGRLLVSSVSDGSVQESLMVSTLGRPAMTTVDHNDCSPTEHTTVPTTDIPYTRQLQKQESPSSNKGSVPLFSTDKSETNMVAVSTGMPAEEVKSYKAAEVSKKRASFSGDGEAHQFSTDKSETNMEAAVSKGKLTKKRKSSKRAEVSKKQSSSSHKEAVLFSPDKSSKTNKVGESSKTNKGAGILSTGMPHIEHVSSETEELSKNSLLKEGVFPCSSAESSKTHRAAVKTAGKTINKEVPSQKIEVSKKSTSSSLFSTGKSEMNSATSIVSKGMLTNERKLFKVAEPSKKQTNSTEEGEALLFSTDKSKMNIGTDISTGLLNKQSKIPETAELSKKVFTSFHNTPPFLPAKSAEANTGDVATEKTSNIPSVTTKLLKKQTISSQADTDAASVSPKMNTKEKSVAFHMKVSENVPTNATAVQYSPSQLHKPVLSDDAVTRIPRPQISDGNRTMSKGGSFSAQQHETLRCLLTTEGTSNLDKEVAEAMNIRSPDVKLKVLRIPLVKCDRGRPISSSQEQEKANLVKGSCDASGFDDDHKDRLSDITIVYTKDENNNEPWGVLPDGKDETGLDKSTERSNTPCLDENEEDRLSDATILYSTDENDQFSYLDDYQKEIEDISLAEDEEDVKGLFGESERVNVRCLDEAITETVGLKYTDTEAKGTVNLPKGDKINDSLATANKGTFSKNKSDDTREPAKRNLSSTDLRFIINQTKQEHGSSVVAKQQKINTITLDKDGEDRLSLGDDDSMDEFLIKEDSLDSWDSPLSNYKNLKSSKQKSKVEHTRSFNVDKSVMPPQHKKNKRIGESSEKKAKHERIVKAKSADKTGRKERSNRKVFNMSGGVKSPVKNTEEPRRIVKVASSNFDKSSNRTVVLKSSPKRDLTLGEKTRSLGKANRKRKLSAMERDDKQDEKRETIVPQSNIKKLMGKHHESKLITSRKDGQRDSRGKSKRIISSKDSQLKERTKTKSNKVNRTVVTDGGVVSPVRKLRRVVTIASPEGDNRRELKKSQKIKDGQSKHHRRKVEALSPANKAGKLSFLSNSSLKGFQIPKISKDAPELKNQKKGSSKLEAVDSKEQTCRLNLKNDKSAVRNAVAELKRLKSDQLLKETSATEAVGTVEKNLLAKEPTTGLPSAETSPANEKDQKKSASHVTTPTRPPASWEVVDEIGPSPVFEKPQMQLDKPLSPAKNQSLNEKDIKAPELPISKGSPEKPVQPNLENSQERLSTDDRSIQNGMKWTPADDFVSRQTEQSRNVQVSDRTVRIVEVAGDKVKSPLMSKKMREGTIAKGLKKLREATITKHSSKGLPKGNRRFHPYIPSKIKASSLVHFRKLLVPKMEELMWDHNVFIHQTRGQTPRDIFSSTNTAPGRFASLEELKHQDSVLKNTEEVEPKYIPEAIPTTRRDQVKTLDGNILKFASTADSVHKLLELDEMVYKYQSGGHEPAKPSHERRPGRYHPYH